MPLEIALVEPEIPQNTGNISRTCVAMGVRLHLVEPLGFSIDDRSLKRAGLDYWFDLDLVLWPDLSAFLAGMAGRRLFLASTRAARGYAEVAYPEDAVLVFGPESRGLPEPLLLTRPDDCVRIPMRPGTRSLNLSNSVAVVAYEWARQHGFPGLA